ncbi:phosphoglycerate mutase-like protein [Sparassis crispa]|uniref:Phosphoglycerate mutase-like protein n=1 Tax=Sparassis crispa TaxID=139825 RepID=A0A401GMV4_9APHY|nr:phosphoglycerate mutase-like protein [Sparassis crispa]GBE83510.1 phosphoglycerate mutase-like protein [Sparassis crispa]
MVNTTGLLGVVLLVRHGDRLEFFQDPLTYNPAQTFITPLGSVEEYQLGSFLRSVYINTSSSSYINGLNTDVVNITQLDVRADASGEGSVIVNSVQALLQGLYPPTTDNNITLANGSTIIAPLGGYQYIPVDSVEEDLDISLNSFTDCPNFDAHISEFYSSPGFLAEAQEAAPFLADLAPYLGNRSTNFTNMWNIFDYVNVQSIHNKTFYDILPAGYEEQAYYYANYHENGVFTDPVSVGGIGNIAIQTILPSIFTALTSMADGSDGVLLMINEISYKPFISLFNVTDAALADPSIAGIVDYAAAVALELSAGDPEPLVTMKLKNGTTDAEFHTLSLFGTTGGVPLSQFIDTLAPIAVNNTQQWCAACNQTTLRGCSVYYPS